MERDQPILHDVVNSDRSADDFAINCNDQHSTEIRAINCNRDFGHSALPSNVQDFLSHSLSESTKRSYKADLAHFEATGRTLPARSADIASYIAEMAGHYAVATIERRLASLVKAHRSRGYDDPCKTELVKSTLRGIRRALGTKQRQAAAILRDDLFAMLDKLGDQRPKDVRDRALLLLGFATAMRRSELASLDVDDIEFIPRGMMVNLRRSKTDQEGHGRMIAVPLGRTKHCPVAALKDWLDLVGRSSGSVFVCVNKHGHMLDRRVSGEAVSLVVKTRIADAGYDPEPFSGHSLRAGFATSAAQAGASTYKIKQTTGHRTESSLARYIRDTDLFTDAAISRLL
ncbi:integrase [Pseudochrobactrum saccharolyticum]|uniref:Integrase n=1 Tax=Pseudochrobactrum saccharolyticum TaxID=354352 RepID=A0A7W8ALK7_9HYPH|nr:site-specific integrase [Pseudochrobactrum saccharolyticum]KAB0537045.1 site-specific integrase [Pseudochrobactrum saccharolyticum]MBB5092599.1 integrase [Pseudochrobactrum saccharolyticum]